MRITYYEAPSILLRIGLRLPWKAAKPYYNHPFGSALKLKFKLKVLLDGNRLVVRDNQLLAAGKSFQKSQTWD